MKITRIIFLTAAVTVSQGYADAEKIIHLQKGQTQRIEEESSPSMGHSWVLLPLPKNAPITIVEEGWEPKKDAPSNNLGTPGKQYWIIKARDNLTKEQTVQLRLLEKSPWLKDYTPSSEIKEYTVHVH